MPSVSGAYHQTVNKRLPLLLLGLLAIALARGAETSASLPQLATNLVQKNEGFWRSCTNPPESLSSRTIFAYALALCEARQHPERLERLLTLAAQMQDRDPKSRQFGNFRWYRRDPKVMDANAVDFCMRGGLLIWLKHRDFVPAEVRPKLRELLDYSVQGCRRHKVASSYSNIAIMNAGDLILLGEALENPDAAADGYARLQAFFDYTAKFGVHEFVSPTYTGTDLDGLGMIEAFTKSPRARAQARALLELFWTDITLNWFPPGQRLAGAHSRTYDFLYGRGYLDVQLQLHHWIDGPPLKELDALYGAEGSWHPSARIVALSKGFPRLVRQSWGDQPWHSRTHYVCDDVTLSASASAYGGRMDMPLTVDLPGPRPSVRGYFVADGRGDPYGKNRIAAGPHSKAFHLDPFWSAVQRENDALALVVYREKDIPTNAVHLESNFVMPLSAEEFRVGDQPVKFMPNQPMNVPVPDGKAVFLKQGTAIVGLRVPWSRACNGQPAPVSLVHDGNEYGAVRLAVQHAPAFPVIGKDNPGAVLWLRIGSGLKAKADFRHWREQFADAAARVSVDGNILAAQAGGAKGELRLTAAAPWSSPQNQLPAPARSILELDGEDLGQAILAKEL